MTDQASGVESASALETFSHVTSVRPRSAGIFDAEASDQWTIVGRPNGGYLLALMGRVASAMTDSGHVIAASAHYLRSPDPGPVEIEGEVLRRGRSISQVRVRLSQGGRPYVEALMSTSDLDPSAPPPRWDAGMPEAPPTPFDECLRLEAVTPDGFQAPIMDQVELRLEPDMKNGLSNRRPSGRGLLRGWLELPGGESFDPISLLYAVDAFPPATFDTELNCLASTVELTVYVRAIPAPGPVRITNRARLVDSQCVDQTCDVWDGNGRLVAHATQLSKVMFL